MKKISTFVSRILLITLLLNCTLALAQPYDVYISSRGNSSIKHYDGTTGQYKGDFVPAGSGGLSFPQEVIFHPDGSLIVTGRFNAAIKHYHGQTGAYLGNFTTGYNLDQPTKTTLGPDGLLYVSQWGTQNKVVRFNWQTGAFVDEFTNVGVPQGMGQAWDAAGNMYVCRWGQGNSGDVVRFDTAGSFDTIFIPTGSITGPVNLWFDGQGHLLVADWSQGDLVRFDSASGTFIDRPVSNMTNIEGAMYDDQGALYLCDWGVHRVAKYDTSTWQATTFISNALGGLQNPNSITLGPVPPVSIDPRRRDEWQVAVGPNPVAKQAEFSLNLPHAAEVDLAILDLQGREVAQLAHGFLSAGQHHLRWQRGHLATGLYIWRLSSQQKTLQGKLYLH